MLGTERRGCFEPPSDTNKPNSNIDCLDIVPIESEFNVTNIENMKVDNQLVHPDSANINRYIMGTRLQTRGAKGKVKRGEQADVEKTKEITEQPEGKSVKEGKCVKGGKTPNIKKSSKGAHKLPTCQFHDLDLCNQGAALKTMSQGNSKLGLKLSQAQV